MSSVFKEIKTVESKGLKMVPAAFARKKEAFQMGTSQLKSIAQNKQNYLLNDDSARCGYQEVQFQICKRVEFGQAIYIVGSSEEIGNWDYAYAVRMSWNEVTFILFNCTQGHFWSTKIKFNVGKQAETNSVSYSYFVASFQKCSSHRLLVQYPIGIIDKQAGLSVRKVQFIPGNNSALKITDVWNQTNIRIHLKRVCQGEQYYITGNCKQLGQYRELKLFDCQGNFAFNVEKGIEEINYFVMKKSKHKVNSQFEVFLDRKGRYYESLCDHRHCSTRNRKLMTQTNSFLTGNLQKSNVQKDSVYNNDTAIVEDQGSESSNRSSLLESQKSQVSRLSSVITEIECKCSYSNGEVKIQIEPELERFSLYTFEGKLSKKVKQYKGKLKSKKSSSAKCNQRPKIWIINAQSLEDCAALQLENISFLFIGSSEYSRSCSNLKMRLNQFNIRYNKFDSQKSHQRHHKLSSDSQFSINSELLRQLISELSKFSVSENIGHHEMYGLRKPQPRFGLNVSSRNMLLVYLLYMKVVEDQAVSDVYQDFSNKWLGSPFLDVTIIQEVEDYAKIYKQYSK